MTRPNFCFLKWGHAAREHYLRSISCNGTKLLASTNLVCTSDVNSLYQIPVTVFDVLEADITKNTGVVDKDIDTTEGLNSSLDDFVSVLDTVVVGNGFTTVFLDLINDDIGSL